MKKILGVYDLVAMVNPELDALQARHPMTEKRCILSLSPIRANRILDAIKEDGLTGRYVYTQFGGFVPNCYKGKAEADFLRVDFLVDFEGNITVDSVVAVRTGTSVKRSYGKGYTWYLRHGSRYGRIVA